jgi:taurine dioxygenase
MRFIPLSDHIGAQVHDLDLDRPISAEVAAELHQALGAHKLLLFRQGSISDDTHVRLLESMGRIMREDEAGSLFTHVGTTPDAYVKGTDRLRFHSDWQCAESGALQVISLYAEEMEHDDPTIFADMTYAARSLPSDLRDRVASFDLVQCTDFSGATPKDGHFRLSAQAPGVADAYFPRSVHPLLGRHRVTGEELLNVSEQQTSHIVGMSEDESDVVFAELAQHQYGDDNRYVHHWQVGDLVIWDNIALQHARDASTGPSGRRLRRVVLNELDFADLFAELPEAVTMS